jgi:hypothetical protein
MLLSNLYEDTTKIWSDSAKHAGQRFLALSYRTEVIMALVTVTMTVGNVSYEPYQLRRISLAVGRA